MSLNDTKIRSLKPSAKPFKVSDSHGLYLLVNPGGSRLWYLKYRINGKEPRLGSGGYPDVSLSGARQQRDGIRKLLAQNINPAGNVSPKGPPSRQKKPSGPLHWTGIKATEHGQRTTPPVCFPASTIIFFL